MFVIPLGWLLITVVLWHLNRRGRLRHDYHNDLLALGALALATAGFFWRLLFTPQVWMPVGGGDLVSFLYPIYRFIARSIRMGDIPLWNPYLYGGAPFAADNQSGLFYLPNLAFFLLRSDLDYRAMELLAVAQFYLAGACAYLGFRYIQRPPLKRWAAMTGAAAFMFSDLFVTHFGNLNMIACAAWLPLIFCLFHRALVQRRFAPAVGAGLVLGLSALAGHVQPLLYTLLALGLYFAYRAYANRRCGWRVFLRTISLVVVTLVVALGVAAPALIPSYEMSRLTVRADSTYEHASQYSLPPAALIGLVAPGIFGRGPTGFWAPWPRVEVGYVGILPLLLAGLAVLLRRDSLTRFLALLAMLATFLAFGGSTILHGWVYRLIPGFNLIRAPARFVYLLDFALAALAALGMDALLRPIPLDRRSTWRKVVRFFPAATLGVVLLTLPVAYATLLSNQDNAEVFGRLLRSTNAIVFALLLLIIGMAILHLRSRHRIGRMTLGLVVFSVVVFDLASLGAYTELELNDPTAGFDHQAAIDFLKSDPDYYRIDTRTEVWDVWQPNLSLMHGIFDVWGIYNPLVLADYHRYWEGMGSRSTSLYDFLNAKYIVGHKNVVLDWTKYEMVFDGDARVNIYRNTKALPRAFIVHQAWLLPDQGHAWAAIHRPDFDPATIVVIETGQALAGEDTATSEVSIQSYSNNEICLNTYTSAPGYLVMSEVYYPGWRVQVNGRPADLLRANYAFRAVLLPPGNHQVRFYFQPSPWRIGVLCSLLTWAILSILTVRRFHSLQSRVSTLDTADAARCQDNTE